jgi:hypothetical protein
MFLPDTIQTIVSADIFSPPLEIEGASPQKRKSIYQHQIPSSQTSVEYIYTNKDKGSDDLWRQWIRENPQEANDMFDKHHPVVDQLLMADFRAGK